MYSTTMGAILNGNRNITNKSSGKVGKNKEIKFGSTNERKIFIDQCLEIHNNKIII